MKSIQTILTNFKTELDKIENLTAYHFEKAEDFSLPYAVWAEEGEGDSLHANNEKKEQTITGSLDFFTETEFDPLVDSIQETLNGVCAWSLEGVQYENETKLIHYTWIWELN